MKLISTLAALMALAFTCLSAPVFPASTNGNNTFFGTNTFLKIIIGQTSLNLTNGDVTYWTNMAGIWLGSPGLPGELHLWDDWSGWSTFYSFNLLTTNSALASEKLTGTVAAARLPGNVLTNGQSTATTLSNTITIKGGEVVVGANRIGSATTRLYDIMGYSSSLSMSKASAGSGFIIENSSTITGGGGAGVFRDSVSGGVKVSSASGGAATGTTNLAALDIYANTITVTNGVILPQIQFLPTNSIPASNIAVGVTNWIQCNVSNYAIGTYFATNSAGAAGSFLKSVFGTVSAFP